MVCDDSKGPDACLFGDIMNLLPGETKQQIEQGVVLKASVTSEDVARSLKTLKGHKSVAGLIRKDGRLVCDLGDIPKEAKLLRGPDGVDVQQALQAGMGYRIVLHSGLHVIVKV